MKLDFNKLVRYSLQLAKVLTFAFCGMILLARIALAQEITAIDFNGDLIGKVIPDGNVVSFDNRLIGNVTADSLIVNFDGDLIGGVIPQGIAIGNDTSLLGKVSNDGTVRLPSGKVIGKVLPNGLVVNDYYDILGAVLFPGLIYDDQGKTVGRLTGDGLYTNLKGQPVGFITPDGYAYRKVGSDFILDGKLISSKMVVSLSGNFLGSIVPGGEVSDFEGKVIGHIKANGFAYDEKNVIIGHLVRSSYAFDLFGRYLGLVTYNGEVINKEKLIGKIRADGKIINDKDSVIGFAIDIAATASDLNGRYLGRIMPSGRIARAKELTAQIGPRGDIINDSGKIQGQIIQGGPVFDYRASLIAHALSNTQVIALSGNPIGRIINNQAFNLQGRIIGATQDPQLVINANNSVAGVTGINSKISNGEVSKLVSPYGIAFSHDGSFGGQSVDFAPIYNQIGAHIAGISLNGEVLSQGTTSLGRLTQSGLVIDERNLILGKTIMDTYAVNPDGGIFGEMAQNNLIIDKSKAIVAKVTPDNAVIKTDKENSTDLMPKLGTAFDKVIVIDFDGSHIGYVDISALVRNFDGTVIGRVTDNSYVLDNNNILSGFAVSAGIVINSKCETKGVITPKGDVRNFKDIYIGRVLTNKQVIDETGNVIGYAVTSGAAVNYNGNIVATLSGNGQMLNYANEVLGCIDAKGQIKNKNGAIIAKPVEYFSVIDFKDTIIGRTTIDGTVIGENSQVLGTMQPDGNVNSRTGSPLGNLFKYTIAFDNDNRYLGRVLENGHIQNDKSEDVGTVAFDGSAQKNSQKIGYALYDFYAYDNDFNTVGLIGKDGVVKSFTNKTLGNLKRGFVVGSDNTVIARGNRDFYIRDSSNLVLGELNLNGDVKSSEGETVGKLANAGEITDKNGSVIATAKPLQYYSRISTMAVAQQDIAIGADGRILGRVNESGQIVDATGKIVGQQDSKGNILDDNNKVVGRVINPNNVLDKQGNIIGKKTADGRVISKEGLELGKIDASGFMKNSSGEVVGFVADTNNVVNQEGAIVGRLQPDNNVVSPTGEVIGSKDANNNIVDKSGAIVGILDDNNAVRDETGKIIAHVQPDNKVVDFSGKIIGFKDSAGRIMNNLGQLLGKVFSDGRVYDENGKLIGFVNPDGSVVDENGKTVGKLNEDGSVTDANNNIIGGIGSDWYEKIEINRPKRPSGEPTIITGADEQNKYRKSLNIALTPDGNYLGDIMDDGSVVDKSGNVLGQKTPDGLVIDRDGTLIGIEEVKKTAGGDIFVPAGTFGQGSAYGTGVGTGDNLGPGGGYGPGERYDPQRNAALAVAQGERRQNMQVGKISTEVRKEAFDGMQKDWGEQGIAKSISSWRVNMSEMILADKPIPAVLARSIDSNNPTPVTAIVERNVYAEEGRNIIIPAGSRIIGELGGLSPTSESSSEAAKVQISWQRLIRPDGSIFVFDGLTADAQGRGGALGYLDKQLFKRYSMPVLTSVLTNGMAYMMAPAEDSEGENESPRQEAANDARQNFLDQMNQLFEKILEDKADITPMAYVPAGTRIIIFPKVDLWIRSFENDKDETYASRNKPQVLINDRANNAEAQAARTSGGTSTTGASSGGGSSVSYETDQTAKPASVPLIDETPVQTQQKPRPIIVPPPPPPSSGGSTKSSGSGSSGYGSGSSSSGSSNSSGESVPQLF